MRPSRTYRPDAVTTLDRRDVPGGGAAAPDKVTYPVGTVSVPVIEPVGLPGTVGDFAPIVPGVC